MSEGLMKMAEGYEMIAAGIRQMVSEGRSVPKEMVKESAKSEVKAAAGKTESPDTAQVDRKTVRAFLTEKSRAGKTTEVKSLIMEFGYSKLSDVPDEKLEELYQKAQVL